MTITVVYDPVDGKAVAEWKVAEFVSDVVELYKRSGKVTIFVGLSQLVDEFRIRVIRREIEHEQLLFMFNGQYIKVDPTGMLERWPTGFCDFIDGQLTVLLDSKYGTGH